MPKDIVSLIVATTIDSSSLTGNYQAINPTGLPFGCFIVYITNPSDEEVVISVDGTNQHEVVLRHSRITLFGQNNSGPGNQKAYFPKGMIFYAKGIADFGNITLTAEYNPE